MASSFSDLEVEEKKKEGPGSDLKASTAPASLNPAHLEQAFTELFVEEAN